MKCEYGCGNEAVYQFKNGKWCCKESSKKCPEIIKKSSDGRKGKKRTEEQILNISVAHMGQKSLTKGKSYKELYGEEKAIEIKEKMRINKLVTKDIDKIKIRYPFLYLVEEFEVKEETVYVKCKNSKCNRWFEPTYTQIYERHRALTKPAGFEENNFYCSENCKNTCTIYGASPDNLIYSHSEYQIFRNFVLERDNYECQYCGNKAEHVHHERPKKLEPFFALDPDLAWSVCKKCHISKSHKKGTTCSTGNLSRSACS